jgi:hypothetical protein
VIEDKAPTPICAIPDPQRRAASIAESDWLPAFNRAQHAQDWATCRRFGKSLPISRFLKDAGENPAHRTGTTTVHP